MNSHAAVSCSRQYAPQWELNFYMVTQDLFLLNPKILIPTCFPVEMAGVKMGQMTYRVRRAPPSPPIPLHSTDWGPEGRLKQGKALGSRGGEWAIILRTVPFIGLVQTFPSTGYSTAPKRRTANYGGGNQAGEVGRAPSEES